MISSEQWELLNLLMDKGKHITMEIEEVLTAAHWILSQESKLLESSLEILDSMEDSSTSPTIEAIYHEETNRHYWKVQSRSQDSGYYLCLQESCSCPFFMTSLRQGGLPDNQQKIVCKHLVAIRLATALRRVKMQRVPLERFLVLMEQMLSGRAAAAVGGGGGLTPSSSFSTPHYPRRK
eukprot:gene11035-12285_t